MTWREQGRILPDFVIAADPGLLRLRQAVRVTLTAALSAWMLSRAAVLLHQPSADTVIGTLVGMLALVVIADREPVEQRRTTWLALPVALAAFALAAAFHAHPLAGRVVFIAVIFVAVLVRRFGVRGTALGTLAFLCYFDSLYFRITPAQVPWVATCTATALAIGFAIRFALVRDDPARVFRGVLDAFHARLRLLTRELWREAWRPAPRPTAIRTHLLKLNEAALALEDLAPHGGAWREELLDAELAAEAAAITILERTDPDHDAAIRGALETVDRLSRWTLSAPTPTSGFDAAAIGAIGALPPSTVDVTRTAVQAATASAIAMIVGRLLSPERWYWAVIAAYFVFARAGSAGETVARAWQRAAGTAIGVAGGLVAAELVSGSPTVELAALFTAIFGAYYLFRVSHVGMMIFLTTALAILYRLLGAFTPGLLYLRLEETMLGALIGAVVAWFVLPSHPAEKGRETVRAALEAAAAVMELAGGARHDDHRDGSPDLQAAIRQLDRAVQAMHQAMMPRNTFLLPSDRGDLARSVEEAASLAFTARHLARVAAMHTKSA